MNLIFIKTHNNFNNRDISKEDSEYVEINKRIKQEYRLMNNE